MGLVQRQSLLNTIAAYTGIAIGFVNKVLLFPRFLTTEELGLANVLILIATIYAQVAAIGFPNAILRFFPFFRSREDRHHGFLPFVLGAVAAAFLVATLLFAWLRPQAERIYSESPLLLSYYWYVIPLALCTLYANVFHSYLRSLYRTSFSSFVSDVYVRLANTLVISLFAFGWLSFEDFVIVYVIANCSGSLVLLAYIRMIGHLFVLPQGAVSRRLQRLRKNILVFGAYSMMSNVTSTLITIVDALMITAFLGLGAAGIYTTMVYAVSVVLVPSRALYKIANPLVADCWKSKNMQRMGRLYKDVTSANLAVSLILIVGLLVNLDILFEPPLLPVRFEPGKTALIILVCGRLFDIGTGLNAVILMTSKDYRYDVIFTVALLVLTVVTNLLLIPPLGISGAALATSITIAVFNLSRVGFVFVRFRLQPFVAGNFGMLALAGILVAAGVFFPAWGPTYFHAFVRSFFVVAVYAAVLLRMRLSPRINAYLRSVMIRIGWLSPESPFLR